MANVYRVRTELQGVSGAPYFSTQFYELIGASSLAGAEEASDAVRAFWSALSTVIDTAITIAVDPVVDELSETSGELVTSYVTSGTVTDPAGTGDALPRATQGLLRLLTGQVRLGRRVQGRVFIPGPLETANGAGVPASAYLTSLDTAGTSLIGPATNAALAVWRRPIVVNDVVQRAGEAISINDVTPSSEWAILRTRRD